MWMAVAAGILLVAAGLYILPALMGNRPTAVQAETVTPNAVPVAAPIEPARAGAYLLSKTIEVTGFRFVVDFNSKSEIHYLVVNHSPVQLGAVTVYVTLRGGDSKPGQPPVARFSFRAPDLGAYASREMTSPIEKIARSVSLPEWQDLRADVEIGE